MEVIEQDKYLWLEEVLSEKSLDWARNENKKTVDHFAKDPEFELLVEKFTEALQSKEKIPFIDFFSDGYVYNTWFDEKNIQGLLRRSKIEAYKNGAPEWDELIDFDVLSAKEGQKWVFHGATISPNEKRALLCLSPGGTDADTVREFDLSTKSFVKDGFTLPVSKGSAVWRSDDELFIIRDFGPETLTGAGYPRTIRKLLRGQKPEEAEIIFSIPKDDTFVFLYTHYEDGKVNIIVHKRMDFYSGEIHHLNGSTFKKLEMPTKFEVTGNNLDYLFMGLRQDWAGFKSGDFVAYNFHTTKFELIFSPDQKSSVYSSAMTKDGVLLIVDTDVKGNLYKFTKNGFEWTKSRIDLPSNGSIDYLTANLDGSDFLVAYNSHNTPLSYFYGQGDKILNLVKKSPAFFNYENIEVSQQFAKSNDGTMIPYFLVHQKGLQLNGKNPTILYGYGGFEISLKSSFSNLLGLGWLEKGGVYVLSNIRGGGEYGPLWHQCALKENRVRTYQDFFSIAEELIAKKITSPEHLGAMGGSNGGLLMGVCYTQRPDLFKAINCGVPLLDMHRYHKLLAGHSWVAEYGNPDDEIDGKYIRALSPYHRIDKNEKNAPVMYINTSTKDDRVHPGHARKFTAKLVEFGLPYFYYENIDGGHAGASNMRELAFVCALDYMFFWKNLT